MKEEKGRERRSKNHMEKETKKQTIKEKEIYEEW